MCLLQVLDLEKYLKTAVHGIRKRRESWTRSDAEQQMCLKTKDCLEYLEQEENVDRHGPFADRFKEMLEGLEWDWSASAFRDGSVYQVHCRLSQLLLDYALSVKRPRFVCLQTSRKLLANFKKQEAAGMRSLFTRDDTYKTNYQGLPIEVPSTSDLHHHCHLGGVAVKSHEDSNAAMATMVLLTVGMKKLLDYDFKPELYLSDHSWAFLKANRKFREAVEGQRGSGSRNPADAPCYAHLAMAIKKTGKGKMRNKGDLEEFRADVEMLHMIKHPPLDGTEETGEDGVPEVAEKLFVEKWRDGKEEEALIEWFVNHWTGKNWGNWGAGGLDTGIPHANNGAEGMNNSLKKNGLHKDRAPLGQYLAHMRIWLVERGRNELDVFPVTPDIPLSVWRAAQLMVDTPQMRLTVNKPAPIAGAECVALVPSAVCIDTISLDRSAQVQRNEIREAATQFIRLHNDPSGDNRVAEGFDAYTDIVRSFHVLQKLEEPLGDYILYSCTCKKYLSYKRCKHVLAYGLVMNSFVVPSQRSLQVIGRVPQVGRPRKAAPALEQQPESSRGLRQKRKSVGASTHDDPCCMACGLLRSPADNPIMFCDGGCDLGYHLDCSQHAGEGIPAKFVCQDCDQAAVVNRRQKKRAALKRKQDGVGKPAPAKGRGNGKRARA